MRPHAGMALFLATTLLVDTAFAQSEPIDELIASAVSALDNEDFDAAAVGFEAAFEAGNPDGAFYLGRMLELGLGGPPNIDAAIGPYIVASERGSSPAKNRLGLLHIQGNGVLQDYALGATLICDAAVSGDMNGAFNCARLTQEGRGVSQDGAVALSWFEAAADLGHIEAKIVLADALIAGTFGPPDVAQAVILIQETVALGVPAGLYKLAELHVAGTGVAQDPIAAHQYFNLAASLGHPAAPQARAAVEANLTFQEISIAQERARNWTPSFDAVPAAQLD
jgi:TPR repeat protein